MATAKSCVICGGPHRNNGNLCGSCLALAQQRAVDLLAQQQAQAHANQLWKHAQQLHNWQAQPFPTPPNMVDKMVCVDCDAPLPPDSPHYQTRCRRCYSSFMRLRQEDETNALLKRALEAEAKVELAKRTVLQLQSELRKREGDLRRMQGQVGLRQPAAAGGGAGVDLATLQRLRRLCHPDKHNQSAAAVEVTAWLNLEIERLGK